MGKLVVAFLWLLLIVVAVWIYLLPAYVANRRGHRNTTAIFWLNLLGGWFFPVWLGALVWALLKEKKQ